MQGTNKLLGLISAVLVIFIWSGFIVFSRAGVTTNLTAYDVAALRFMVAGAAVLPFVYRWWPRQLPLNGQVIIMIFGPGVLYSILMYLGLTNASAAYGGVFANGSMPIFTVLLGLLIAHDRPSKIQVIAILVIVFGGLLVGVKGMMAGGPHIVSGIILFLSASMVLSIYLFSVQRYNVKPTQALVLVNLPNALFFIPLWYFFLPSGIHDVGWSTILFQAFFQGLGPGFFAIIFIALTAIHLGSTTTAAVSASVPAFASMLAVPVLGEVPSLIEWFGIGIVSAGLLLMFTNR